MTSPNHNQAKIIALDMGLSTAGDWGTGTLYGAGEVLCGGESGKAGDEELSHSYRSSVPSQNDIDRVTAVP